MPRCSSEELGNQTSRALWVGLGLVLAERLLFFWLIPLSSEDAFISFHAAIDPAWRAATTSPLWSLLISPGDPFTLSRIWALAADTVAIWAAWTVLPPLGYWAFLGLWVSPFFTGSAVSGLETHAVAAMLLLSRVHPIGYAIAAALRPDAAAISLLASGRKWRWALAGTAALLCIGYLYNGHVLPQTAMSKALVYGIHPGQWQWLHPKGFGWETLAFIPVLCMIMCRGWDRQSWTPYLNGHSRQTGAGSPFLHAVAAVAFLGAHVVLGTIAFWWYAVPPLAVIGLAACEKITRPRYLILAFAIMLAFSKSQCDVMHDRTIQERQLWNTAKLLQDKHPTGTMLLEPAGIIPYLNPQLHVIDDVGLVDPWMATRRSQGPGWRTDAIARYRPKWIVIRIREYLARPDSAAFIGKYPAWYGPADYRPKGYWPVIAQGVEKLDAKRVRIDARWSNLLVLMKPDSLVRPK